MWSGRGACWTGRASPPSGVGNVTPYREVEHTADLGLLVWGDSLQELFSSAALGMFALMRCPIGADRAGSPHEVSLAADDLETLLVDWLGELLYLHECSGEVFSNVEALELEGTRLRAVVVGRPSGAPERGIKAVTYSGLQIRETEHGYRATLTLDV